MELPPACSATAALPQETALPAPYLQLIDGKPFVKYAGLLTLAHAQGLQQLEAWFTGVSDTLAVAHATATFRDGRRFSESGEATPENVGSQVRPHFARLALTRAKARCLRDALNIALCAVEELGGSPRRARYDALQTWAGSVRARPWREARTPATQPTHG